MIIVKIPFSEGSLNKNKGTELAPNKLTKSKNQIKIIKNNTDLTYRNIEQAKGDLFIGGDHSITYPLFKSFSKKHKNPGLIILDAHPDAEVYTKTPTHEDFVRKLIDEKFLKQQNLTYIGLRNISKNEKQFLKKITWFKSKDKFEKIKQYLEKINLSCDALYLSIDTDVLDSKYYTATGYPEPKGLTPNQLFKLLKYIKTLKIKKIDIVEYNPTLDKNKEINLIKKIIKILHYSK